MKKRPSVSFLAHPLIVSNEETVPGDAEAHVLTVVQPGSRDHDGQHLPPGPAGDRLQEGPLPPRGPDRRLR